MDKITFVLTSCGRLDLLEKTLDTFFKFNNSPIERYIVTEDSADKDVFEKCKELNKKYENRIEFHFNETKLGQTKSIDRAYSSIITPYIFHCEDDWEFYEPGFIQKSINILKSKPEILQAWIRPKSDGVLNTITPHNFFTEEGIPFRKVMPISFYTGRVIDGQKEIVSNYMGFSFNPGIKRLKDWTMLGSGGYSQFKHEHLIDMYYRDLGFSVVSLSTKDNDGYVRHIGTNRRVENTVH